MPDLVQTLYFLIAIVISITVHEFFHAWTAFQLGDPTAKYMGRLSLNPVVHFDPLGALMIVFMAIGGRGLGWGRPVPYNPNNLRNGPIVGGAIVSIAGPLSNLLVASAAALPLRLMASNIIPSAGVPDNLIYFMYILFQVSISLLVFNLLPIPPLDGYAFWLGVLHSIPSRITRELWITLSGGVLQQYGPMLLLVLVFWGGGILSRIMSPVFTFFSMALLGPANPF
jgi:Zn-dependent protease